MDREQSLEEIEQELNKPREMLVSEQEMDDAQVPIPFRDYCAHLLIPLNRCRHECFYLPWKCSHEKHAYELCQYEEYKRRVKWMILEKEKMAQVHVEKQD